MKAIRNMVFSAIRNMVFSAKRFFIKNVLKVRFIVNESENNELGVRICGINCFYYKWPEPLIYNEKIIWRVSEKREFGESIHSVKN